MFSLIQRLLPTKPPAAGCKGLKNNQTKSGGSLHLCAALCAVSHTVCKDEHLQCMKHGITYYNL